MKPLLVVLASLIAGFAATTWWALESGGVAVVETQTSDGGVRSTHIWYAEPNGELWVEAGTPENPWFRDVQQNPLLTFHANGHSVRYVAQAANGLSEHNRIRSLIREKYGVRDRWVGLLVDTSNSVAVHLVRAQK